MSITNFFGDFSSNIANIIKTQAHNGRIVLDYLHSFFNSAFYFFLVIAIIISFILLMLSVIALFRRKSLAETPLDFKKAPFVTIQIPTRNEIIALKCAEKCLEFDYPKNKFEILIGDDSDNPEVSKELQAYADKHPMVKVLKRKENIGYKPGNLNNMLKHTKGEIIVIFDSDFAPEKDFLRRIVAPFLQDKNISAVQAKWNFFNKDKNLISLLASTIVFMFHNATLMMLKGTNSGFLCGSAEAVRKKDLVKLGGWTSGSLTEDIEYSLRMHKNNKRVVYLPNLECYNQVPDNSHDLYKQQMRWAYGVISAYKQHAADLIFTNKIKLQQKCYAFLGGLGYLVPVLMMVLFLTGMLSFITDRPAPIDLIKFFGETGRNILLTSGLIFATIITLYIEKRLRYALKLIISSFSYGIMTSYYVNIGIIKAILNKPMPWYLLKKIHYSSSS